MADLKHETEIQCDPSRGSLIAFAKEVIAAGWNAHVDEEFVHCASLRHRLISETTYNPAVHGPNDVDAMIGDPWFVFAGPLSAPGIETEGQDPKELGAKHESPIAVGEALPPPPQTEILAAVPEGWVLAPREPTPEMMLAARGHQSRDTAHEDHRISIYRAMISRVQSPSRQEDRSRSEEGRRPDGHGLSPSVEPLRVSPADAASIPGAEIEITDPVEHERAACAYLAKCHTGLWDNATAEAIAGAIRERGNAADDFLLVHKDAWAKVQPVWTLLRHGKHLPADLAREIKEKSSGFDDRDLCNCRIGQCRDLTEKCREDLP